ncbi:MAG: hypothetical protein FD123_1680 [Bacteroidetes bacterium]|nr:MAG: hypothetical protein FD123_1680 [Bacteroidota bacterium]
MALGRSVDASDTKSGLRPVWAVYFGATGISNFTINTVSPSYYALRPLSNTLVSKNNVFIQDYQAGVLTGGKNNNYQAVDMETWVLTFLSAVDLFLGPAYAAPASTLAGSNNAYNRIVSAKKTLADKISTGLDYVLDVTPDTAKLGKAREAIKDQLLINLTKAYNSDALLQYDIAIGSPFSGGQSPRLSGAPVSKLYRTGIADSVSTVATFMHVSVDYLTEQIDQFTGILDVGLVVTYPGGGDYTITNTDTIATVAQHYNVTSQALVAGLSWPDPQTQGLFLARTIITITGLSQVSGTQTIEQIAEFFAAPIVDWAYANEDNTGIFIEGVTISVPGYSSVLVTASNNSLDLVAAEMTGSPQMTATELALQLRSTTGILAPAFTSYMVLSNFSFSASTSKISLATGTNQVNFLLDVSSEAEYRKALLGLNYAVDELEFNIRDIAGADGYQASSWLSFVIPIGSSTNFDGVINTNLGQPDIPLPLRSYPVAPIITAQDAEATYTDAQLPSTYPQNVEEASEWNFSFTYLHQEAAQDTNYIMATFNLATEAHSDYMQAAVPDDFFTAFAQFISVWPALKKDLDALAVPGTPPPTLGSTLDTLATLVENIADTWVFTSTHLSMTAVPAQQFYEYSIVSENEHHDDADWKATMTLTPLTAGNTGPGDNYPNIYYIDTSVSPPVEHELTKTPGNTDCVYTYPPYTVPAIRQLEHRVEFIQLDVMNYQNALGGSFAARNMILTATPTNENFVFQTPEVLYSHSIIPYITRGVALEFGSGNPATQLEPALTALFSNLFGTDTPLVKISALYGYELATGAGSTAIVSRLPIVFLPMMVYDTGIPANLAQAVNNWLGANPVATTGGELLFDLSVFSGTDESNSKPLLRLSNLIYSLSG